MYISNSNNTNEKLANTVGDALIKIGNKFKAGTSEITEDEAIEILRIVAHEPISREQVCREMNITNNKFYDLLDAKKIPAGRKRRGFKELTWYRDEIRDAINKLKGKD